MKIYDFDKVTDRRGTSCLKYDFAVERGHAEDCLPFWVADMDFPCPEEVTAELIRRSQHGIFGYTDVKEDYKEVLRQWFQQHHQWTPAKGSLMVTPGVVYALCTAVRAFSEPGDAVLIQRPVYYPFSSAITENGRRLVNSPLVFKDGKYHIDFVDFEQTIIREKVKLFLLCNPHNPVGRVWTKAELEQLGEICLRHQVLVVSDEIHQEFIRKGHTHTVFAGIKPEFSKITITCTAPSKTFNLAGLQISNIFIENKELLLRFRKEVWTSGYSQPNALGMFACQAAYAEGADWLRQVKDYIEMNLQKTKNFLQTELPEVTLVEPEGTYLIWLDLRRLHLSEQEISRRINEKANIWLDEGKIFGSEGEGFQRINIACPWVVLEEGLKRLKTALTA